MNEKITDREQTGQCFHCLGKLAIRNPTGYCDHLYYPENCSTCKQRDTSISYTTVNFKGKRHGS
jgi:hypothetical protein